jgi:glutaredoxin-like YruB-family protein
MFFGDCLEQALYFINLYNIVVTMKKVKIYSQPTCSDCNNAKAYLKSKGVKFEDINVGKNKKALEEMSRKYGVHITPVIVIDDHVMVGFNMLKIDRYLS